MFEISQLFAVLQAPVPVPRALVFSLFSSFYLVASTAFSCES
jgi:hypothetical protein